eukprot:scaffold52013_cov70-Phaeocystis_antarctica.AAC.4
MADPSSGPIIWPSEKLEAIRLLSALTDESAEAPHELIMSSITGVMLMDSPSPKSTRAAAICGMATLSPVRRMGLGPMSRKPTSWSTRPVTMTLRGPSRERLARMPMSGHESV